MKKTTLSELSKLNNVKEVSSTKKNELKGGNTLILSSNVIIINNAIRHGLGFVPPPGM